MFVCVLLGFLVSNFLLLCVVSYEEVYAFSYNPKQNDQQREEGWQIIDLGAEFERMGVPCDQWQLTNVNIDYKVDSWLCLVNHKFWSSEVPNCCSHNCFFSVLRKRNKHV